jgi:3-hydroxybutyryl-CoA dehydrogenase
MGPLALLDLIGIDTAYEILNTMYAQSRDRLHAPQPMLRQLVTAGLLGRKSGRGFYTYAGANSPVVVPDALTPSTDAALAGARPLDSVGIVGSGRTAIGIAQLFATAGLAVTVVARSPDTAADVEQAVTRSLDAAVKRGSLSESQRDAALARVSASATLADLGSVQLVVEAVAEDPAVKPDLFAELDRTCAPGTVLATTTSSVSVIECAAATSRPADVIGMHFVNPAAGTRLVEVVSTVSTAADVEATVLEFCRRIDVRAVRCGDRAGFVVDALLFPYLNDAVKMLEAQYASADDIDSAMKLGCGYPAGPFELLDDVGIDVALAVERRLFQEVREPGLAPAPLLEHLVTAGRLGRKTGKGFRDHT